MIVSTMPDRLRPGDTCPECGKAALRILNSFQIGDRQVGYFGCPHPNCRHRPEENKIIRPADSIRRRWKSPKS
jgi:hypothetical protein